MPKIDTFALQKELLIVGAAAKIGLFDIIKNNPLTIKELSRLTKSDARALWVVTEALVALEYLYYENNRIKLTKEAYSMFYDPESRSYTDFSFMHRYNLVSTWLKLPRVLKSGRPVSKLKKPDELKDYISAMRNYAKSSAEEIAQLGLKGFQNKPRVLDVGGGPLTNAVAFAQKGGTVTVLDLPEVVDMMVGRLETELPIEMVKGDFRKGLPKGPYDLIYLGNVCHLYGEKINRTLFVRASRVIKNGGRLVIKDIVRGTGQEAALFAVNMLLNTKEGGTWTYEQYKGWLQSAGFEVSTFKEVDGGHLIMAEKR